MVGKEHLYIYLDANILYGNKGFNSRSMQQLLDYARQTKSNILLHDIALKEVNAKIASNLSDIIESIKKNQKEINNWCPDYIFALEKDKLIKTALDNFEKWIPNSSWHVFPEEPFKKFLMMVLFS